MGRCTRIYNFGCLLLQIKLNCRRKHTHRDVFNFDNLSIRIEHLECVKLLDAFID